METKLTDINTNELSIEERRKILKAKRKEYYIKNKDKIKEYYKNNKEKILKRHKDFMKNNPNYSSEYYNKNKDKILEARKEYYSKNKDKIIEYVKKYTSEHKDKLDKQKHELVLCEVCNKKLMRSSLSNHKKTKQHLSRIK